MACRLRSQALPARGLTRTHRNQNLSHITTGLISNSPSKGFVQVDEAFAAENGAGGSLASSYFNYANTTKEGLVDNTLTTYGGNSTKPVVFRGYVNSNFPIFEKDLLVKSGAVFGGLVQRQFVESRVAAVNIPVALYMLIRCELIINFNSGISCIKA